MFNRPRNTGGGVSPVVAVILLVAVTVTLSAVIGGFALSVVCGFVAFGAALLSPHSVSVTSNAE